MEVRVTVGVVWVPTGGGVRVGATEVLMNAPGRSVGTSSPLPNLIASPVWAAAVNIAFGSVAVAVGPGVAGILQETRVADSETSDTTKMIMRFNLAPFLHTICCEPS